MQRQLSPKEIWDRLKPVYFQKWCWEKAVQAEPHKYKLHLPVYQGRKVMLT